MNVLSGGLQGISRCASHLRGGGILAIPTETVYGLAAIATRPEAVAQIFAAKERPTFDPLIVHIPQGWGFLKKLDEQGITESAVLNERARTLAERLMKAFWPGPLTLILPRGPGIPDLVTSGLSTVGVRMPRHTLTQTLLRDLQAPLAAPSANRFGQISPTTSDAVMRELGDRVPFVLEGGPCEVGLESTIVHLAPDGTARLLRPGGLSKERIELTLGSPLLPPEKKIGSSAEMAPGMLASHYAPRKALDLFSRSEGLPPAIQPDQIGVLWLSPPHDLGAPNPAQQLILSTSGQWEEMARRLFSALRELDEHPKVRRIFAETPTTDEGLALAIRDRLQRASAPKTTEPPKG